MSEANERERVIEILKQARRPEAEISPESLEENLRWLVHAAMPEEKASDALRQRVQALTAAHPARRRPVLARLLAALSPPRRRALAGAIPLAVASILLILFFTISTPAQVLARTLNAMARVRTAHCTGWMIGYRARDPKGRPIPERMNVEWWYKAPDRFVKDLGPESRAGGYDTGRLTINRGRNVFVSQYHATRGQRYSLPPSLLTESLSALDFFSREGIIQRAQREGGAQVTEHAGTYHERPARVVELEVTERKPQGSSRARWALTIDPSSDLVLRSHVSHEWRDNGRAWETMDEETLDSFEYNIEVKDSLFHLPLPAVRLRPDLP